MSKPPVFLTEPKIDAYPKDSMDQLEALVSGVTQMSQSTLLLKKRKEMREVDDALEFMKEEYALRMEAVDERQREFERKQQEMREQVTRFEKFIRENDAKRQRAEAKEKSEHRSAQLNHVKRQQLSQQLLVDQAKKEELQRTFDLLYKYRLYLERIVDSEGEYDEISIVLNRHATLVDANHVLKQHVASVESNMDQLRNDLRSLRRAAQNQVLVENSEIQGHQQSLEMLRTEGLGLEVRCERETAVINAQMLESGQAMLAVKNLYARCVASSRIAVPPLRVKDKAPLVYVSELLAFVASRLLDLDYIGSHYSRDEDCLFPNIASALSLANSNT